MFSPILVHDYLKLSATRFPDKEALVFGEERWTYKSIEEYSSCFGDVLLNIGVKSHDRVVIFMDNCPEIVIALFGVLKARGTFVILNGSMKAGKLAYIMRDSGAEVLITHTGKAGVVLDALSDVPHRCRVIWSGDPGRIPGKSSSRHMAWSTIFEAPERTGIRDRSGSSPGDSRCCIDTDLASLVYTSGSTGEPKGVMSSHYNMVSAARSIIQYLENTSDDIILNVLPLAFDYGIYQIMMAFMFGGTVVLEKSFLYPNKVLDLIQKENITGFPIVPTIAALLLRMQNLSNFDFSSLRYITNTAAALPVDHIHKLRALFPHVKLYSMFGLTECKRVSYLPPEELDRRPLSVGKAIPNCEVFIVDGDGREVPPGEVGELVVRGANVMCGYWNAPELTARTFRNGSRSGERLLHSGDFFRKDEEGFLYFVARKDEMIKSKGERVSPKEVENVLCGLKGIVEAAVIGVADEVLGQAIKAFVSCDPEARLTEKDILKHCTNHLEAFMIPKYVRFLPELPRTSNGKVDKRLLRTDFP